MALPPPRSPEQNVNERSQRLSAQPTSKTPIHGLDDAFAEVIALLQAEGPLTTRAIGHALPHLAIPVTFGVKTKHPAAINAHTKVLQGAGFAAGLVRAQPTGAWTSAEYLWVPTEDWLGQPITGRTEAEAAPKLPDLWLRRFGPATETDIAWWFGWTAGLTRKTLTAIDATVADVDEGPAYVASGDAAPPDDPGPWVRLLPGLDATTMGWKERDWYVDPAMVPRFFDRNGNAGPTVWADGQIVGGWIQRPDGKISIELARELSSTHQLLLDEAIDQLQLVLGDAVVRPRFPAPVQKDLFDRA